MKDIRVIRVECVACTQQKLVDEIFTTNCNHNYCHDCLIESFKCATRNEEMFPVRCCKVMSLAHVEHILSLPLQKLYKEKAEEYTATNRVYCSDPNCSKFITS